MKPSELQAWRALPETLTLFRAHRPGETDWIAYTLDPTKAGLFARQRNVDEVAQYTASKSDALCLFLRRGEAEVLILDRSKVQPNRTLKVVLTGHPLA